MIYRIHCVSGPSHQLVADGQPVDRYQITIQLVRKEKANLCRFYAFENYDTKEEAESKCWDWHIGENVDLPDDRVFWIKGGKLVNVTK